MAEVNCEVIMNSCTSLAALLAVTTMVKAQTPDRYTLKDFSNRAEDIVHLHREYNQFYSFHHLPGLKGSTPDRARYSRQYNFHLPLDWFGSHQIKTAFGDSTFVIIYCAFGGDFDGPEYTLAFDYDGACFLLQGFPVNEFSGLVRSEIGPVDTQEKALKIAELYILAVRLVEEWSEIYVTDDNLAEVHKDFPSIKAPSVVESTNGYSVTISTMAHDSAQVTQHHILIDKESKVSYSNEIVRKSE